jgi:DNA-binding LacI/PurR family transcriptional regulator
MRHPDRYDGRSRLTIEEVAAKAGVSTATVSRVLAGSEVVTASRAARVRQAIAELGYVPNPAARALASAHSRLVGVLAPRSANGAVWALLDALEAALARDGFGMLLALAGNRAGQVSAGAVRLCEQDVAAVIQLPGAWRADERVLASRPVVTVATVPGTDDADIAGDDWATARAAGHVLRAMAHRHVLVVHDRFGRAAGLRIAQGLADRLIVTDAPVERPDAVDAALRKHLGPDAGGDSRPTVILCNSDRLAREALATALRLGVAVPRNLSVIGWGEDAPPAGQAATLATVRLPTLAMAAAAVAAAIHPGSVRLPLRLTGKLVLRRTLRALT